MKFYKMMGRFALGLAAVGLLIPNFARAELQQQAAQQQPAILDVQLRQGGTLIGQVLSAEGAPVRKKAISIRKDGQEIARTATDDLGKYEVQGLRPGVYQVVTTEGGAAYRLWTANTAPPAAQPGALMITGQPTRGQLGRGGLLTNPWVLGGIAAGAIIGPILATQNDSGPISGN